MRHSILVFPLLAILVSPAGIVKRPSPRGLDLYAAQHPKEEGLVKSVQLLAKGTGGTDMILAKTYYRHYQRLRGLFNIVLVWIRDQLIMFWNFLCQLLRFLRPTPCTDIIPCGCTALRVIQPKGLMRVVLPGSLQVVQTTALIPRQVALLNPTDRIIWAEARRHAKLMQMML